MGKYYKHPTYGHVYGLSIPTPIGRGGWPNLVKPKAAPPPKEGEKQGAPRYEQTLFLQKDNPSVIKFCETIKNMTDEMIELFNHKRAATIGGCRLFGKNGDGDEMDLEKYPFAKGCHVLVARNANPVKVVNKERKIIEPGLIEGGVKVRFVINPIVTAHGISYKLEAVQLWEDDGVRFAGAARDAVELFDACSDDDVESETEDTEINGDAPTTPPEVQKSGKKGKAAALDLL